MLRKDIGLKFLSGIALTGALLLGGCKEETLLDDVKSRGELVIGIDPYYPPQSEHLEDGTWVGYDVEVAMEIAERLGVTARIEEIEWDEALAGNWRGRVDLVVDSMAKTEERNLILEFVEPPYRYETGYFLTRAVGGVAYTDIHETTKICVSDDTTYSSWFAGSLSLLSGEILKEPPSEVSLIRIAGTCDEGTVNGDYDLYLDSYEAAVHRIEAGEIVATGPKLVVQDLFIAVDRSSPMNTDSLRDAVSAIVQEMHDDGTLTAISMETYGVDFSVANP